MEDRKKADLQKQLKEEIATREKLNENLDEGVSQLIIEDIIEALKFLNSEKQKEKYVPDIVIIWNKKPDVLEITPREYFPDSSVVKTEMACREGAWKKVREFLSSSAGVQTAWTDKYMIFF